MIVVIALKALHAKKLPFCSYLFKLEIDAEEYYIPYQ
jgi:hypothetical protein